MSGTPALVVWPQICYCWRVMIESMSRAFKAAREEAGMTRGQLAKHLHIKVETVVEVEAGRHDKPEDRVFRGLMVATYTAMIRKLNKRQPAPMEQRLYMAVLDSTSPWREDAEPMLTLKTPKTQEGRRPGDLR